MLDKITVLILTYNERENIGRVLARLTWASRVLVLDSGSTDGTLEIVSSFANTRVAHKQFESHAQQWNFGLNDCGIDSEWVMALDADYLLTDALVHEVSALSPVATDAGYVASFDYAINGKRLVGSMYPPGTVLYRRAGARYVQDGHTQRIVVDGNVRSLNARIIHDDRKPLSRWLAAQDRYAELEVGHIASAPIRELAWPDKLRRCLVIMPWLAPLYCLFVRLGFVSGRAGVYYALQRGIAESLLSLKLIQHHFGKIAVASIVERTQDK